MPAVCSPLSRSPSTVRASGTVLAGYKEDNVTTMLNGPYRDANSYSGLASMSRTPPATAMAVTFDGMADRRVTSATAANRRTTHCAPQPAATSRPQRVFVRVREKQPDRHTRCQRDADAGRTSDRAEALPPGSTVRRFLLADEHDGEDGERDSGRRAHAGPLSERNRDGHRYSDGTHRRDRRDDRHRTDRECTIQQRDTDPSSETCGRAPHQVASYGRRRREKRKQQSQRDEPGTLRDDDDRDGARASRRKPAKKIGSAV